MDNQDFRLHSKLEIFQIAKLLIDKGSDVNFIEDSEINEWRSPVLHDCIRATIFNSYTLQKNTKRFDKALSLLELMLEKKANPNSTDSYGNNCLHRAILDARQMIDNPSANLKDEILLDQMRRVFKTLIQAGADPVSANDKRPSAKKTISDLKLDKFDLL